MSYEEREISISEVRQLLSEGVEVEVQSPDGFVPINNFVDKGMWDEYVCETDNGFTVRCIENHLFETTLGWFMAKDLVGLESIHMLTIKGWSKAKIIKTYNKIPIVDISVDHPNHRYYTNGISSHNTGVGKSLFMCHVAAGALTQGKNVLYITLEMAEERIAERIDANLLNIELDQLPDLPKSIFEDRIQKISAKAMGRLIVKEYPTSSAHVGHFKALLNELKLKRSFVPDIIFVDYLNICASARYKPGANVNSYTLIKGIAEELRGMAVEFNVPIVSATQTTRSGYSNTDVELTDTSESFGLPATADFMFALISTEDLQKMNQIMVKQLKNRYSDPNNFKRFMVGIDRAKMRLYDLESVAQQDITDSNFKNKEDAFEDINFMQTIKKGVDFSSIKV